ncbi:MAG: hypothetical protein O3C28_16520, partial [Proteobacteria bacterium]|nr:hypothetical protein [Pseudomonadota bacterium]
MAENTIKDASNAVVQARTILARTRANLLRPKSGGPSGKAGDIVAEELLVRQLNVTTDPPVNKVT